MVGDAWLHDSWIPATEDAVPLLEELRSAHLEALVTYDQERRHAARKIRGTTSTVVPSHQRRAEHQAMVKLCDLVDRIVETLLERCGELERFAAERRSKRGRDPSDVRAIDQLLIGLGTDGGGIVGNVDMARHEAKRTLDGRPVVAW